MNKETEQKIQQLSLLEQSMQNTAVQKQGFQVQLMEINSALKETEKTKEVYKIIANIMIKSDAVSLKKELTEKREVLELRIKSLEKQEQKLREKASYLQKEVIGKIEQK